jgi:hypothetical protein
MASEPETLLAVPNSPAYRFERIGLEAGPMCNGFSALSLKQSCRRSVLKRGTCWRC